MCLYITSTSANIVSGIKKRIAVHALQLDKISQY